MHDKHKIIRGNQAARAHIKQANHSRGPKPGDRPPPQLHCDDGRWDLCKDPVAVFHLIRNAVSDYLPSGYPDYFRRLLLEGQPTLELLNALYTPTLTFLKETGGLTRFEAMASLAMTKTLRKWRVSDESRVESRKVQALEGFVLRNSLATTAGLPPQGVVDRMRAILASWLPRLTPEAEDRCIFRHGNGAIAQGLDQASKRTDALRLLWASRECCYAPPEYACRADALLSLEAEFRPAFECSPEEDETDVTSACYRISRLCAVPKQYDKDRLITVEPLFKAWLQQHARQVILESVHSGPLRGSELDLGYHNGAIDQQKLAKWASKNHSLATIDLKDASDNITLEQVRAVFPPWVVCLLEGARSAQFESQEIDCPPTEMRIFAGMGNATTFIVETLFFAAYCIAIDQYAHVHDVITQSHRVQPSWAHPEFRAAKRGYRESGVRMPVDQEGNPYPVSVFGDDIVCSSRLAQYLVQTCKPGDTMYPGLVVNEDKSFWGEHHLREACGIFAYEGLDITTPRFDGYAEPSDVNAASFSDFIARLNRGCPSHEAASAKWERYAALADKLLIDPETDHPVVPDLRRIPEGINLLSCSMNADCEGAERQLFFMAVKRRFLNWHLIPNYPILIEGLPSTFEESCTQDRFPYRARWNRSLQRSEFKVPVCKDETRELSHSMRDGHPEDAWSVWAVYLDWFGGNSCVVDKCGKLRLEPSPEGFSFDKATHAMVSRYPVKGGRRVWTSAWRPCEEIRVALSDLIPTHESADVAAD